MDVPCSIQRVMVIAYGTNQTRPVFNDMICINIYDTSGHVLSHYFRKDHCYLLVNEDCKRVAQPKRDQTFCEKLNVPPTYSFDTSNLKNTRIKSLYIQAATAQNARSSLLSIGTVFKSHVAHI